MSPRKVLTRDGSPTLYSERFKQHYHNMAGALTESRYVYFERTGVIQALENHIDFTVFEVGFGTGFHLLLLEWLRRKTASKSRIHFFSVEKYPVDDSLIAQLDYTALFPGMEDFNKSLTTFTNMLYTQSSGNTISLQMPKNNSSSISAQVFRGDFLDIDLSQVTLPVHFILHDAFSIKTNPELWSQYTFERLFSLAKEKAMLGTYASATEARAAMVLAGWHVARCPGPPGKREMTLASPDASKLTGYKRINEQRLRDRFGI